MAHGGGNIKINDKVLSCHKHFKSQTESIVYEDGAY